VTPRPRRPARAAQDTTQAPLDFTAPAPPRGRAPRADPDQIAKAAIARRTKPAATPGHVRLTLTLELPRELAERLSARAIREEKNLELLVLELLDRASRGVARP
jgi:hypothetical protein